MTQGQCIIIVVKINAYNIITDPLHNILLYSQVKNLSKVQDFYLQLARVTRYYTICGTNIK